MASFIDTAVRAAAKGIFGLGFKATLGNPVGRMATGAIAGGAYGAITSGSNSAEARQRDIFTAAAIGAGIGGLTTKTGLSAMFQIGKGVAKMPFTKTPYKAANIGLQAGKVGAGMALSHPYMTLGAVGLGAYAYSNTESAIDNKSLNTLAMRKGSSTSGEVRGNWLSNQEFNPTMLMTSKMRAGYGILQDSTHGLVQGLHQGRHR